MAVSPDLGEEVLIEGGADAREAALGSSFADLIKAGDTLDPVETTQAAGASPSPVAPQPADPTAIQPVRQPREPVSPAASTVEDVSAQLPNRLEPVSEAELIPPSRTEKLDVSVSDVSVTLPTPEMTRPVKPAESWKPVEDPLPVETAIPANVPTPVAKPEQPKQPPRKTAGNIKSKSEVNSKAGTRDGKATGKAASSGKVQARSASASSGNAAAANYPGKVFAKIARTRQRNAGGRGVVHVSFHVSTSGQAVRVTVSRSSGNARVDKAALAHIKRAAPFPRPPSGARTRFVIPIEFRR
ncbi:energy transducer TonB family protein [Hoeflea alexandrii]|uniref:TonB family protein n=1 Tax=Hoeflea alexandrii TaxID=288436 RepID=A0ABT1CRQ9_9HYPH|nr:TonB family protein [Hoeflea alexandrii]MCO6408230.1 TonB family protein [Hoeflea alexandrii]